MPEEEIVPENERCGALTNEIRPDDKCLSETLGPLLHRV